MRVRAALYLDFDNIFGGLIALDPESALAVAQAPLEWLERLSVRHTLDGPRSWLVRRCYMNPAGWVADPRSSTGERLYFSKYRPYFTRAGFEVIIIDV
ncbi:MAG: hypothetical protein AB7Q42_04295 [Acidimicrobiia bacterium]